jgi:nucleoside transporter
MSWAIRLRLGTLMFFQYFVWGAWYVTLGAFLALGLHFSGTEVGWAAGTTAVGAIVAPFFVGLVADRFFATQRTLAMLHLVGGVLLWLAAGQHAFAAFYAAVLAYSLCYMPTLALSNSLAFRQMRDPRTQFGPIRVFGTIGWIVAGILIGHLGIESTAMPLRIAAVCSVVLGLYCFTLPNTPPLARYAGVRQLIPARAVAIFRERSTVIFALASLLICIPLQFYYAFTNLFLNEIGVASAAAKMAGGQMSELVCMLLIPFFFRRLGVKYMLAVGMLAWVGRYLLFAWGNAAGLVGLLWGGILLHGICYDFFFVTGQIYIDRKAPEELRAATQGLITFLTYGVGMFLGAWLSGIVVDAYAIPTGAGTVQHDWRAIWSICAGCSALVLVLFLLLFADDRKPADTVGEALVTGAGRS